MTPSLVGRATELADLVLRFGRVERATAHPDGVRPETDTDHTVMLAIVACDLAPPDLDRGLIAQFALVHDLVEAECGDTQTLTITAEERVAKTARERAAMAALVERFGPASWLGRTLTAYEAGEAREARWVYVMDKVMPKLTHILNHAAAARRLTDRDGFVASHCLQWNTLVRRWKGDDPTLDIALALLADAMFESETAWQP